MDLLPVWPEHCKALLALPPRHRDPFDRMLIAQARCESLPLLTRDGAMLDYRRDGLQLAL
ncbi:MAG: PIN domain-containing protein [Stellaceae bacterium]